MVEIEEICCESNVNDALIFSMSTHHLFEGKKGNYEYEQMMSILPRVGMTHQKWVAIKTTPAPHVFLHEIHFGGIH